MTESSWRWPVGVTALLAAFVGANLMLMRIATNDPSFAVEPDYYHKAVTFDSTMAQERRNAALGWSAEARLARASTGAPGDIVAIELTDAHRRPITGATMSIEARYNARANQVVVDTLREREPGTYEARIALTHAGEWEIRVDARRGADRFTASVRAEAPSVVVGLTPARARAP